MLTSLVLICVFGGKRCVKQDPGGLNEVQMKEEDEWGVVEEGDF